MSVIANSSKSIITASLLLLLLLSWRYTFQYASLALVFPMTILIVLTLSRFRFLMHRKKYVLRYYFKQETFLFRLLSGRFLTAIQASISSLIYTFSLCVFVALASFVEGLFLLAVWCIVVAVLVFSRPGVKNQAAVGIADTVSKKLAIIVSFLLIAPSYIVVMFNSSIPAYVDATSIISTMDAASQSVVSISYFTNMVLKAVTEFTAAQWYSMVVGMDNLNNMIVELFGWFIFLLYSGVALLGMSVASAEFALMRIPGKSKGGPDP